MEAIKKELNEAQQEAVLNHKGPALVIAGAGSGKTRVLTYRIAYLLSLGIPASRILALTFTNKAASAMKERIATHVSPDLARSLWMGTFHSLLPGFSEERQKFSVSPPISPFTIPLIREA